MTTTKRKCGKVIIASTSERLQEAKARIPGKAAEVIFPPLGMMIACPITRSDRFEPAPDSSRLPPAPNFAGFIEQGQADHGFEAVTLAAYLVKSAVEQSSLEAVQEAAEKLADRTGLTVLVDASGVVPQPAPVPQPALPRIGTKLAATPFALGKVQAVPSASLHALRATMDTINRGVTVVSYAGPDRLIAMRHGSVQRLEHRLFGRTSQTPTAWLRDVIRSLEPRLLIVEGEALTRAELDLDGVAKSHRIAVGVLPAPSDPGHTTTQMLKET